VVEADAFRVMGVFTRAVCLFLLSYVVFLPGAHATDKSSVKPNVLSLPSGPGSIDGLGEAFQPQLNSGTASHSVPLAAPPGRAGFAPSLALQYNSGAGMDWFGMGWRVDLPFIQRQTERGLPRYRDFPGDVPDAGDADRIVDWTGEELVFIGNGVFRKEHESDFTRYARMGDGWEARRSDGVRMWFGSGPASQVSDGEGRVFRWLIEGMEDPNGNRILFTHEALDDTRQLYCRRIEYNQPSSGEGMAVVFEYEERPDPVLDYRPTFLLATRYRCTEIRMTEGGSLVRAYRLAYAATSDVQPHSLLASITQVGRDGVSTLPPASFTYTTFDPADARTFGMDGAPTLRLGDGGELFDVTGNGLPDIIDTRDTVHDYFLNLGPDGNGLVKWSGRLEMQGVTPPAGFQDDNTQVADLDGDAVSELLVLAGNDILCFVLEGEDTARGWRHDREYPNTDFRFDNPNVRLVDLNGDRKVDALRTDSLDFVAWYSEPNDRWSAAEVQPSPAPGIQFANGDLQLADMNGDRLLDLVRVLNDVLVYYPSMGFGRFGPPVVYSNSPFGANAPSDYHLIDVNGNGLSDVVLRVGGGSQVRVWLNKGVDPHNLSAGLLADPFNVSGPYADGNTQVRAADMNGNGSVDLLFNTFPSGGPDTFAFLDFAPGEQPYQLKQITNGIGLTTTLHYRSTTEYMLLDEERDTAWESKLPTPFSVLSRIETNDGVNPPYVTDFHYSDPYYDPDRMEFRGFAGAEMWERGDASAPTLATVHRFHTGFEEPDVLKGRPISIEYREGGVDGPLYHRETMEWVTTTLLHGKDGDARLVYFAHAGREQKEIVEKGVGLPVILERTATYFFDKEAKDGDFSGSGVIERTVELNKGRLDGDWNDERRVETIFSSAYPSGRNPGTWILDRTVETKVTDETETMLASHQRNFYDGQALGGISKGNLTKTEDWVEGGHFVSSIRNDYDAHGNVIAQYDPNFGTAPGHFREFVYDSQYQTFPEQEIIHTGSAGSPLVMRAAYDAGWGVMTSSTEFNGHVSTYQYDAFGRLIGIVRPGDLASHPTEVYDYQLAQTVSDGRTVNWIETRLRETPGGGSVDSRTFFDGMGRAIMTRSQGETPGQVVVTDTVQFNSRGTPWRTHLPYFDTGSLAYAAPDFSAAPFITQEYDALGRETRTEQPDGTFARVVNEPLARFIQDEEQTNPASPHAGCGTRMVYDGLLGEEEDVGRLREVHEIVKLTDDGRPGELTTWVTQYEYDLRDLMTGYTDAQGNVKRAIYDGLRRLTRIEDPNMGWVNFEYDDAGNLLRRSDVRGQVLEYTYDGANRRLSEAYPTDSNTRVTEFHYDAPQGPVGLGAYWNGVSPEHIAAAVLGLRAPKPEYDLNEDGHIDVADVVIAANRSGGDPDGETRTARNTLGALAYVVDDTGEEHRSYDARGRQEWTVKRIRADEGGNTLSNFYTEMAYDSQDRLTSLTYPDGMSIGYAYNPRGMLAGIDGVISSVTYNPDGALASLSYANGVNCVYEYDVRLRLRRMHTTAPGSHALQSYRYTYDGVSNIVSVADERTENDLNRILEDLGLEESVTADIWNGYALAYDSVYRLTSADRQREPGAIAFRYDRIGNKVHQGASGPGSFPTQHLGAADFGGQAGSWGRQPRTAGSPPGPQALTATAVALDDSKDGGTQLAYDDAGNVVALDGAQLTWDAKNRLVRYAEGPVEERYVYDHADRRVVKRTQRDGATRSEALYVNQHSEVRDGHLRRHVYLQDRLVAVFTGDAEQAGDADAQFLLHDHLGSTEHALSRDGEVRALDAYFPYGARRASWSNLPENEQNRYGYIGREEDAETGLLYLETRYMHPRIGAFLSPDGYFARDIFVDEETERLTQSKTMNTYAYGGGNPVIMVDPDGRAFIIAPFLLPALKTTAVTALPAVKATSVAAFKATVTAASFLSTADLIQDRLEGRKTTGQVVGEHVHGEAVSFVAEKMGTIAKGIDKVNTVISGLSVRNVNIGADSPPTLAEWNAKQEARGAHESAIGSLQQSGKLDSFGMPRDAASRFGLNTVSPNTSISPANAPTRVDGQNANQQATIQPDSTRRLP